MTRITTLFLIVLLYFMSCAKHAQILDKSHWYIEDEVDYSDIKKFLSKVKIVSLETNEYLVGDPEKIIKDNSIYYILDNRHSKCIYIFNTNGKEHGIIKKFGQGNNEYLDIKDFDLDNEQIVLLCYPSKLIFIDKKNLTVKNTISLPQNRYYDRLTIGGKNILLYDHFQSTVENINLITGKTEVVHNTRRMKGHTFSPQPVFYRCSDNLFYHAPGNDTIYTIKNNQFNPVLIFDYEAKKRTVDFYSNREPLVIEPKEICLYPYVRISTIFKQEDSFGFIYTFGIFQRINTIKNGIRKEHFLKSYLPFKSCYSMDNKQMITYENSHNWDIDLKDRSEYMKDLKVDKNLYHKNETEDNPIIFEYTIK